MKGILSKVLTISALSISLVAAQVTQKDCDAKGEKFIFAGDECVQLHIIEGERENMLNLVVHGTWKKGTNTLGRYAPFADDINMNTDITTVAVALPGYSKSSSNHYNSLKGEDGTHYSFDKKYLDFMVDLIEKLKDRYEAKTLTYIGHSAAASMGATIAGYKPNLINNLVAAGGKYDVYHDIKPNDNEHKKKGLVSAIDYVDKISKDTKIVLVYGTKDDISLPEFSTKFAKVLKSKNIDTKIVEVKNGVHLDLDMTDPSKESITKLLEE
jgi:predicted esterase